MAHKPGCGYRVEGGERMTEQIRLLPKGSMIHTLRGQDWHFVKFWYLPKTKWWEVTDKHPMGKCVHCKIWTKIEETK